MYTHLPKSRTKQEQGRAEFGSMSSLVMPVRVRECSNFVIPLSYPNSCGYFRSCDLTPMDNKSGGMPELKPNGQYPENPCAWEESSSGLRRVHSSHIRCKLYIDMRSSKYWSMNKMDVHLASATPP